MATSQAVTPQTGPGETAWLVQSGPIVRLWTYALAYFLCYVPYAALTKALALGEIGAPIGGLAVLPSTAIVSMIGMVAFLGASGWWRRAGTTRVLGRLDLPTPSRWTLLAGLATATIIMTTTLSYALSGVSILVMMVLMRGGVLVIAPLVDGLARRRVHSESWIALAISVVALAATLAPGAPATVTGAGLVVAGLYVGAYFVRLRVMSRLAKSGDTRTDLRYFVEEQMVATPALVVLLALVAIVDDGAVGRELARGFAVRATLPVETIVGLCSQGTGIFGALVLLGREENTYCVPLNRASSVLAGVVASGVLTLAIPGLVVSGRELVSAGLLIGAVAALAIPRFKAVRAT